MTRFTSKGAPASPSGLGTDIGLHHSSQAPPTNYPYNPDNIQATWSAAHVGRHQSAPSQSNYSTSTLSLVDSPSHQDDLERTSTYPGGSRNASQTNLPQHQGGTPRTKSLGAASSGGHPMSLAKQIEIDEHKKKTAENLARLQREEAERHHFVTQVETSTPQAYKAPSHFSSLPLPTTAAELRTANTPLENKDGAFKSSKTYPPPQQPVIKLIPAQDGVKTTQEIDGRSIYEADNHIHPSPLLTQVPSDTKKDQKKKPAFTSAMFADLENLIKNVGPRSRKSHSPPRKAQTQTPRPGTFELSAGLSVRKKQPLQQEGETAELEGDIDQPHHEKIHELATHNSTRRSEKKDKDPFPHNKSSSNLVHPEMPELDTQRSPVERSERDTKMSTEQQEYLAQQQTQGEWKTVQQQRS